MLSMGNPSEKLASCGTTHYLGALHTSAADVKKTFGAFSVEFPSLIFWFSSGDTDREIQTRMVFGVSKSPRLDCHGSLKFSENDSKVLITSTFVENLTEKRRVIWGLLETRTLPLSPEGAPFWEV